jgi:hypothetical protein
MPAEAFTAADTAVVVTDMVSDTFKRQTIPDHCMASEHVGRVLWPGVPKREEPAGGEVSSPALADAAKQ